MERENEIICFMFDSFYFILGWLSYLFGRQYKNTMFFCFFNQIKYCYAV